MNYKVIFPSIIGFVIIGTVVYGFVTPTLGKESLDPLEVKQEVLQEVEEYKQYTEKTTEYMEQKGVEDIGFFHPPSEEDHDYHEHSNPREEVLKYFVAGLMDKNTDIFLSSFLPESISRDLFKSENPDKFTVTEDIMDRISRKGTIDKVDYRVNKGFMDQDTNSITVTLIYNDNQKANIPLELTVVEDIHGDNSYQMYVITNSVWDMIEQVEKSTE